MTQGQIAARLGVSRVTVNAWRQRFAAQRLAGLAPERALTHIYNNWRKEFCSYYPDRQAGLACLPYGEIEAAVEEICRVARLGLKGLELSCSWDIEPMWEPLWKAVNDAQLPLHFDTLPRAREMAPGQTRRAAQFTGVAGFQMNLIDLIAAIIGAGVLERYPNLRIGLGESGGSPMPSTGWNSSMTTAPAI